MGTTKSYYKEEYTKAENASYYTQQGEMQGQWHGNLAEDFGLKGTVTEAEYDRLVNGQHPQTAEQLIEHRDTVKTASGEEVAHRAAWDLPSALRSQYPLRRLWGATIAYGKPIAKQ